MPRCYEDPLKSLSTVFLGWARQTDHFGTAVEVPETILRSMPNELAVAITKAQNSLKLLVRS